MSAVADAQMKRRMGFLMTKILSGRLDRRSKQRRPVCRKDNERGCAEVPRRIRPIVRFMGLRSPPRAPKPRPRKKRAKGQKALTDAFEPRSDFLRVMQERGFVHQCSDLPGLDDKARSGALVGYIGFDCTAPSLHVGSLVRS